MKTVRMLSKMSLLASLMLIVSCQNFKAENRFPSADTGSSTTKPSFSKDLAFLKRNTDILILEHGDPFDFEHWHTPPCIDTDLYKVIRRDKREIAFRHERQLKNWSGNILNVEIDRTVRILDYQTGVGNVNITDRKGVLKHEKWSMKCQ